jgi:hypothetical protein
MAVVRIKDFIQNSDFAGSRQNGTKVRENISEKLKEGSGVTLDFVGINLITQSFGDEVVGILTRTHGIEFIKNNLRIHNSNDEIKSVLNYVVKYSQRYFKEEAA